MPPRRSKTAKEQLEELRSTFVGRWIGVPLVLAVVVVAGIGIVATLLQIDQNLPQWGLTGPAGILVLVYYAVEIWKAFKPDATESSRHAVATVGNQRVSDQGVAPVIAGDGNTVTVINPHPSGLRPDSKLRIQYVRTDPITPASEGWYCVEIANPNDRSAVVTGIEWVIDAGPGGPVSIRTSLGNPLFIEALPGTQGELQVGLRHLTRTRNVEIPPGHIGAFYVKGDAKWPTYTVRATLHITGPAIEDLHHTTILLTPIGYAWNLTRSGPAPPDPFQNYSASRS